MLGSFFKHSMDAEQIKNIKFACGRSGSQRYQLTRWFHDTFMNDLAQCEREQDGQSSLLTAFSSEAARRLSVSGDPVILLRPDTSTADVEGFALAAGIVTSVGARTSHAALVARQMGKPCIVGCSGMAIDVVAGRAQLDRTTIAESDWLTVDGGSGRIYLGQLDTVESRPEKELAEIATWRSQAGDSHRKDATPPLPASAGG
jgi:phosphohistidine swiveling domain-containing protein